MLNQDTEHVPENNHEHVHDNGGSAHFLLGQYQVTANSRRNSEQDTTTNVLPVKSSALIIAQTQSLAMLFPPF